MAKIEAILESTQSAIFAVDKNYLITGFNSAFSKLYQKYFATNTEPQKGIDIQTVFDFEENFTYLNGPNFSLDYQDQINNSTPYYNLNLLNQRNIR